MKTQPQSLTMKAAFIESPGDKVVIREVPIPVPKSDQILVKVEAAPINHIDLQLIQGKWDPKPIPAYRVGFEGSGVAVENGGSVYGWSLKGKKVAFQAIQAGSWAEYVAVPAVDAFALGNDITFEGGSCGFVCPLTAQGLLDTVRGDGHTVLVITAAASSVGRILSRIAASIPVLTTIAIVRTERQVEIMKANCANYIINTQNPQFHEIFKEQVAKHKATALLDCVGGEFSAGLLKEMPSKSCCYIYGNLSKEKNLSIDMEDLLSNRKSIKVFKTEEWLKEASSISRNMATASLPSSIDMHTMVNTSKTFSLDEINEAIEYYLENMTEGKVIIKPQIVKSQNQTITKEIKDIENKETERGLIGGDKQAQFFILFEFKVFFQCSSFQLNIRV